MPIAHHRRAFERGLNPGLLRSVPASVSLTDRAEHPAFDLDDDEPGTGVRPAASLVIVKVCACGAAYTVAAWKELEHVAIWEFDSTVLDLRQCACGSTISRLLSGP